MTSPITDAMVEAAFRLLKDKFHEHGNIHISDVRAALEAALPSALAAAEAKGFAAGVEAAANMAKAEEDELLAAAETGTCRIVRATPLSERIRALRPPAAPAESEASMTIENCPTCGGTHYGSNKCPYIEAPCIVCSEPTVMACADCAINSGGRESVYVCKKPECRNQHEAAVHPPLSASEPAGAPSGEANTSYNAAAIAALESELIGPVEWQRMQKYLWVRSLVNGLIKRIANLRAMLAPEPAGAPSED
jgi:hypothetical protein